MGTTAVNWMKYQENIYGAGMQLIYRPFVDNIDFSLDINLYL